MVSLNLIQSGHSNYTDQYSSVKHTTNEIIKNDVGQCFNLPAGAKSFSFHESRWTKMLGKLPSRPSQEIPPMFESMERGDHQLTLCSIHRAKLPR
jgi:hypothetical protein